MARANFCVQCGERFTRQTWRARLGGHLCDHCAQRSGRLAAIRPLIVIIFVALAGFTIGKHLQPSPPPLIIQRALNSPLSDAPVNLTEGTRGARPAGFPKANSNVTVATSDEAVYICGARTQKGTPCHRRVHAAGERCFQHKGMTAMLPLEKLKIQP